MGYFAITCIGDTHENAVEIVKTRAGIYSRPFEQSIDGVLIGISDAVGFVTLFIDDAGKLRFRYRQRSEHRTTIESTLDLRALSTEVLVRIALELV